MDARSLLILAMSLLLLRRTRASGSCDAPSRRVAELDRELSLLCLSFSTPRWTWTNRSHDLCTANTEYSRCNGKNLCAIPREDYFLEEFTSFCCHSPAGQQQCWRIFINPTVNHTVPQLVRAGKEETAYTIVKAKPSPPKFPGVEVQLELKTGRDNAAFKVRQINSTIEVAPHPSLPLTYVVFHTFQVPLDAKESSTVRLHFERPTGWNSTDDLVYPDIGVIVAPGGTTPPGSGSPSTDGNAGGGTTVGTANCIGFNSSVIIGLAVAVAVPVLVCSAFLLVCLICQCRSKRKSYKSPVGVPSPSPTQPAPPPDNLQIRPLTPNSSTATTPGLTPMGESTYLLSGSAGGVATDHVAGAPNSHFRQHSRDSGSTTATTTPTEGDRLLPPSSMVSTTGQTGSNSNNCVPPPSLCRTNADISKHCNGYLVSGNYPPTSHPSEINSDFVVGGEVHGSSEGPANVPSRGSEGARAKSTDPKHHVYSTVGETLKVGYQTVSHTLTTGTGLSSQHQSLSQLHQQSHGMNHVMPSTSSTLPCDNRTFSIVPSLPADKPEYASHGSRMQLPQLTDNDIVSNV